MQNDKTQYEHYVQDRSFLRFWVGLVSRYLSHIKYEYYVRIARRRGASIGHDVIITRKLAKKCNKNVKIGNHVSIETDKLDTRAPITIGNYVIIGRLINNAPYVEY